MSILVWYFILFVPQLVIGAAIGWFVTNRRDDPNEAAQQPSEAASLREEELRVALGRLKLLTDSVQEDVREHAEKVETGSKELAGIESGDAGQAMEAIAPIVKANEELQQRLRETEQKLAKQAEELDQQTTEARTDPLTGLLNRRGMENELPALLDAYEKSETNFCLTILDIDKFKKFNDDYGHDVGDMVLCEVARVVAGAVRRDDVVARFGGEEFVILSPDTELNDAGQLLERVRTAVEENIVQDEAGDLKVTISLGVSQFNAEETAALMKRADTALYAAKEGGRNCAYFHDGQDTYPVTLNSSATEADDQSDELSKLPDQEVLVDELQRRIAEAADDQSDISLVALEIDQLADITNEQGEETARLVRRGVAAFLANIMREMDLVARDGEDRFSILLPGCTLDEASRVADRVRRSAAQVPFRTDDIELQLTLSAGVTTSATSESVDVLMERCQRALTASLNSGGNRTSVEQSGSAGDLEVASAPSEMAEDAAAVLSV